MAHGANSGQQGSSTARVGTFSYKKFAGLLPVGRWQKITVLIIVIAAVSATAGVVVLMNRQHRAVDRSASRTEFAAQHLAELKNNPPAKDASKDEKINYLSTKVIEEYNSGDYQAALRDYKQVIAYKGDDIGTDDAFYATGAQLYSRANDKQAALGELAKIRKIVNNNADPQLKAQQLHQLDLMQQELEK